MKLIKVTKVDGNQIAYLNTDHIVALMPIGTKRTEIVLTNRIKCLVKESIKEVLNLIGLTPIGEEK